MIDPARFFEAMTANGVRFVVGVPDSLLKAFCRYVAEALPAARHAIAVNEGAAVARAAGHHLATGEVPLVYMQNSGLGNAVNPVVSLADPEVYALPMVLLVGWRGEPGVPDEPQHVKQGRVTTALLEALEVPYRVIDADEAVALASLRWAVTEARSRGAPVALLVRKGAFSSATPTTDPAPNLDLPLTRERAIERVAAALPESATVVATTGMIARELCEYRQRVGQSGAGDFLMVGSMGHASQLALGIAAALPERLVVCLDGDGAVLMHMGALASIGVAGAENFLHVVLNNGAHDSVGGQPTAAFDVDLVGVARACGYRAAVAGVRDEATLERELADLLRRPRPGFVEVRVAKGARADLGRPAATPRHARRAFMASLRSSGDDG